MSALCGKLRIGCGCGSLPFAGGTVSLIVDNLHDEQTGEIVNDASLTYATYEYDASTSTIGDAVDGASGPMSSSDDAGGYAATIPKTAGLVRSSDYWLVVTDATAGVVIEQVFSTA